MPIPSNLPPVGHVPIDQLDLPAGNAAAQARLTQAEESLQRGRFSDALKYFEAALREDATCYRAIIGLGLSHTCNDQNDKAVRFMGQYFVQAVLDHDVPVNEACRRYLLLPDLMRPHFSARTIDATMQHVARAVRCWAKSCLASRQTVFALELLEAVEAVNPAHLGSDHDLGDCYLALGLPAEAHAAYEQAVAYEKEPARAVAGAREAGDKLMRAGAIESAAQMFREAWSKSVQHALPAEVIAASLIDLGVSEQFDQRPDSALHSFTLAINMHPTERAFITRGNLHLHLGQVAQAQADFNHTLWMLEQEERFSDQHQLSLQMLMRWPDYPPALTAAGRSALQSRQPALAQSYFERLLRVMPESFEARLGMAKVSYLSNDTAKAASELEKLVEEAPHHLEARYFLASAQLLCAVEHRDQTERSQMLQSALDHLREVLRTEGHHTEIKAAAAVVLLRQNKPQSALKGFRDVLRYAPDHSVGIVGKALSEMRLGRPVEALCTLAGASLEDKADIMAEIRHDAIVALAHKNRDS